MYLRLALGCGMILAIGIILCANTVAQSTASLAVNVNIPQYNIICNHAAVALKGPQDWTTNLKGYTDWSGTLVISNLQTGNYGYVIDYRDSNGHLWRGAGAVTIRAGRQNSLSPSLMRPGTFTPDWSMWV